MPLQLRKKDETMDVVVKRSHLQTAKIVKREEERGHLGMRPSRRKNNIVAIRAKVSPRHRGRNIRKEKTSRLGSTVSKSKL